MKSILPCSKETFAKQLRQKQNICITIAVVTVFINLLLCVLYTDQNAALFQWINILLDTFVGWFLFGYLSMEIYPSRKLYSLAIRAEKIGTHMRGIVSDISRKTEHNGGLACKAVKVTGQSVRRVYLPTMLSLNVGDEVRLLICDNIVVEVGK